MAEMLDFRLRGNDSIKTTQPTIITEFLRRKPHVT